VEDRLKKAFVRIGKGLGKRVVETAGREESQRRERGYKSLES